MIYINVQLTRADYFANFAYYVGSFKVFSVHFLPVKVPVVLCWLWLKLLHIWKTEKHCNLSTSSQYSLPCRVNCDLDLIYQPSREVPAGSLEPPGPAPLPHLSSRQATSWSRFCDCPFLLVCAKATGSFFWFIWLPGERHVRQPFSSPHSLLLRVRMKVWIFFSHWDAPVPNKWSCDCRQTQRRWRVNSPEYFLCCNFLFSYQVCFGRGWDITRVCLLKQRFIINQSSREFQLCKHVDMEQMRPSQCLFSCSCFAHTPISTVNIRGHMVSYLLSFSRKHAKKLWELWQSEWQCCPWQSCERQLPLLPRGSQIQLQQTST